MKAMCIDSSKNFVWQDVPELVCHGEFDVKIAIKACAVNRADLMHRQGIYAPPEGWPLWPRLECAGEVLECPPNGLPACGKLV
jgi:NADPH:quinone reductase-like Zn-dependent oxidoreductase